MGCWGASLCLLTFTGSDGRERQFVFKPEAMDVLKNITVLLPGVLVHGFDPSTGEERQRQPDL